jgi:hypothetical protein
MRRADSGPILHHQSEDQHQERTTHDSPKDAQATADTSLPLGLPLLPAINLLSHSLEALAQLLHSLPAFLHALIQGIRFLNLRLETLEIIDLLANLLIQPGCLPLKVIEQCRCRIGELLERADS